VLMWEWSGGTSKGPPNIVVTLDFTLF
jgi:hypothetical protein